MLRRVRLYVEGRRCLCPCSASTFEYARERGYRALSKETRTMILLMIPTVIALAIMAYLLNGYGNGFDDDGGDGGPGDDPTPDPIPDEPFAWEPDEDNDAEWDAFMASAKTEQWDNDLKKLLEPVPA